MELMQFYSDASLRVILIERREMFLNLLNSRIDWYSRCVDYPLIATSFMAIAVPRFLVMSASNILKA